MAMKELREALYFACTVEFWRMVVLWTFSLIIFYLHLCALTYFSPNSGSYTRCSPPLVPPPGTSTSTASAHKRPATSGLGAAAADAFSREGFFVVLDDQFITRVFHVRKIREVEREKKRRSTKRRLDQKKRMPELEETIKA